MIKLIFLFLSFFCFSQTNSNHLDGVVAVVGDFVVLKSDVFEQSLLLAKQKNINPQKSPLVLFGFRVFLLIFQIIIIPGIITRIKISIDSK